MSRPLNKIQETIHEKLQNDFVYYAQKILKIKTKSGGVEPFCLNPAQIYLHAALEKQRKEIGKIRALIVKGRQQGCSTYISGRFYHKATRREGQSVFILSHESETTKKLFKIVERFHNEAPDVARPLAEISNKREMVFQSLGSDYSVGTAGNENVGRGGTVQLFHGSEAAFWENADQIQTGILQSVPDLPDTEIILESTANGMANFFYDLVMQAVGKQNDYIVIFIPWYWQPEYRRATPPDGVEALSDHEQEYAAMYSQSPYKKIPLTPQQMYWRRTKISEFKSEWKFKQEYPAFLMEAFQTSGESMISAQAIMRARQSKITDPHAPLTIGVDPARTRDRTTFVYRRGREIFKYESFKFQESENIQMVIAGMCAERIHTYEPDGMFIDVGEGYGIVDRLKEMGYGQVVRGVHFGEEPLEDIYLNKRAEMWCNLRDWIHGEDGEVRIPDADDFQRDLSAVPREKKTSSGKIKLVGKDEIRDLLKFSPDIGDAAALTFAYPTRSRDTANNSFRKVKSKNQGESALITLRKQRRQGKISQKIWGR